MLMNYLPLGLSLPFCFDRIYFPTITTCRTGRLFLVKVLLATNIICFFYAFLFISLDNK